MDRLTLVELQEEKNVVLKDINVILTDIHNKLQNLNTIMSKSDYNKRIDKLREQLLLMQKSIIPPEKINQVSRRINRSSNKTQEKSVQIISDVNDLTD